MSASPSPSLSPSSCTTSNPRKRPRSLLPPQHPVKRSQRVSANPNQPNHVVRVDHCEVFHHKKPRVDNSQSHHSHSHNSHSHNSHSHNSQSNNSQSPIFISPPLSLSINNLTSPISQTPPNAQHSSSTATSPLDQAILQNVFAAPSIHTPADLLSLDCTNEITPFVREVVVDWMMEVSAEFSTRLSTTSLAVSYFDRCLATASFSKTDMQLLALVAILIACKMEETEPPPLSDLVYICQTPITNTLIIRMEARVLDLLHFKLVAHTPFTIISYLSNCVSHLATTSRTFPTTLQLTQFAAHICMLDASLSCLSPGVTALACVLSAMYINGIDCSALKECPKLVIKDGQWHAAAVAFLKILDVWRAIRDRHGEEAASNSESHHEHHCWLVMKWALSAALFDKAVENETLHGEEAGWSTSVAWVTPFLKAT